MELDFTSPAFWLAVGQIVLIDILLGGDNAVVIALAVRKLDPSKRRKGIVWGTIGAIALRILLIVRPVMARVKLMRPNISLNLRACRMEQRAQVNAVPLTHGGKPCRSRTAQNTHEHGLRQIICMMGERYRIAVYLLCLLYTSPSPRD